MQENKKNKGRLDSFYFGDIMFRFFTTKKSDCLESFSKNALLEKMITLQSNVKNSVCLSKNHIGDSIDKDISLAGKFEYTTKYIITRKFTTPIGIYDNTGISILLNTRE